MGMVIRVQPPGEKVAGKQLQNIRQRIHSVFGINFKAAPIANMRFRPHMIEKILDKYQLSDIH